MNLHNDPTRDGLRSGADQARARPLLDDLRKWMEKTLRSLSAKSETAAAIRYALSRWRALSRFTEDGLLEIDNNAAERALRVVALGRKNFLFAGSDNGGHRAAARIQDLLPWNLAASPHTHSSQAA